MVVDTSAIMAILLREPDAGQFEQAIVASPFRLISAATRVELSFVAEGRKGDSGRVDLEKFLSIIRFTIVPVDETQSNLAIGAFRRFGKGRHPAALNIGDCFSYALAMAMDHSLLYKGNDFSQTDVRQAVAVPKWG